MARPYDFFPIQTFKSIPDPTPADANKALVVNNDGSNLVYTPVPGRKNLIINGNFDIWQRGNSQTAVGYGSVDRWGKYAIGSSSTLSRLNIGLGTAGLQGTKYGVRYNVTSVAGAGNYAQIRHRIESLRVIDGKTVTLSFRAKADVAGLKISVWFNGNPGTGGTPSTLDLTNSTYVVTLSTEWVKYTITHTYFSLAGLTLGTNDNDYAQLTFWFDAGTSFDDISGAIGHQSGTFDIAQAQLEIGSEATAFEWRSEGEELALCQRYYFKIDTLRGAMNNYHTSYAILNSIAYPQEMRVAPTLTVIINPTGILTTLGSLYSTAASKRHLGVIYNVTSGLAGRADIFNSFSAHVDAEL